ncbi:MAG: type II 3-dehydroquinate dehydratase [Deltaproteobacteria bacterium]|nr:type II 3-dehydroquinate dehydratase [Deltaproteobacteria bacterium]
MKILTIHGPNLNLLGQREPEIYGRQSLNMIDNEIGRRGERLGIATVCRQSNHEGEIIDWLHQAAENDFTGIILNPAGFTHTSVAIRDAIAAIEIPVIEVHLSNISSRDDFRQKSLTAAVCRGTISGFGAASYLVALETFKILLN